MYMNTIFKSLLFLNRLANQSRISREVSLEVRNKFHINGQGHMTKLAATSLNDKNLQKYTLSELEVL